MTRLLHFIALCYCLVSCGSDSGAKINIQTFNKETHTKFDLPFSNGELWLPKYFQPINLAELAEIAKVGNPEDVTLSEFYDMTANMEDAVKNSIFFQSTLMPSDVIAIHATDYISIEKKDAPYAVSMLLAQLKKQTSQNGIELEVLEKRFKTLSNATMIKLKIKQKYLSNQQYVTQYYVTKNYKSYVVTVKSRYPDDFEKYIKSVSFS